jgi:hypothetical protein
MPLIASVAALLVVAAAAVAGYLIFTRTAGAPSIPVERLLPANTIGYLTVDTAPDGSQQAALDKMKEAFESQPGFKEAWARLTEELAESSDSEDVGETASQISDFDSLSQFLGDNITVALLPPSTADLEMLQSGDIEESAMEVLGRNVVGLLDLDFNPLNKKGPISELKQYADDLGKAELVETHREVEIRKYVTDTTTVYFSLLPDSTTAVVGAQPGPLKTVIDQVKDNTGLKDSPAFTTLAGQVAQERVATLYLNLTEIYRQAQLAAPELLSTPGMQKVEGAVLVTLSAKDDGMQLDMASQANMEGLGVKLNPQARPDVAIVSDVPAGSLGFFAGTDLKTALQSTLDAMRKQSEASGEEDMVTSTLAEIEDATGLNLETDVLPWMGGDYALSFSAEAGQFEPDMSVVFQIKLSAADRPKAEESLKKFMDAMTGGEAPTFEAAGGTFYAVDPEMGLAAGVGSDRFMVVFTSTPEAAETFVGSVAGGFGKGLGSTPQWAEAQKHLPKESNAIVYLDITGARGLAEETMPQDEKQEYEESAAPFLRPFKYLALGSSASSSSDGNIANSHSVVFLGISK